MSLDGLLLEKLARWRPDGPRTLEVSDADSGWTGAITADAVDVVGCRLLEISLSRGGEPLSAGDLKDRAETVASRITGLLEPLRLIEVDQPRSVALLRSSPPMRRDDVTSYYEALLHAEGTATVRRYEAPHGDETRRKQITYTLTHEALGKLVNDLTR
jgi:hypothetical protein